MAGQWAAQTAKMWGQGSDTAWVAAMVVHWVCLWDSQRVEWTAARKGEVKVEMLVAWMGGMTGTDLAAKMEKRKDLRGEMVSDKTWEIVLEKV